LVGDEALRRVAAVFKRDIRSVDRVCRYGGEEFALLLPESTLEDGKQVLERIRQGVSGVRMEHDGKTIDVTVSLGAAQLEDQESIDALVARADKCLYQAKAAGRNRLCVA
jgi:diguanylate cyclase (GGDEF)-like protein